ncbi:MAG: hypothetical protein ACR2MY_11435 [Candidatus Dormibacteria bacterium]
MISGTRYDVIDAVEPCRFMNIALLVRLVLAPALVAAATLAARRWGAAAAGWAAATPVVAGPVLLVFVIDHGPGFGAQAAGAATLGLVSLAVFTMVYARMALLGAPWPLCLPIGWASFVCTTALLSMVAVPPVVALVAAIAAFVLLRRLTGSPRPLQPEGRRPRGDIPLRMFAALVMVLALGLVAGRLGPRVSGLLAPFPIIGSVMAVFTHITRGREALQGYSLALVKGLPSFALFTATVALTVEGAGTPTAFLLASLLAAASHGILIFIDTRATRPQPEGSSQEVQHEGI